MDYEKVFAEMDGMITALRGTQITKHRRAHHHHQDSSLVAKSEQFFAAAENEARDVDAQLREVLEQSQKFDNKYEEREETIYYKDAELKMHQEVLEMSQKLAESIKNP